MTDRYCSDGMDFSAIDDDNDTPIYIAPFGRRFTGDAFTLRDATDAEMGVPERAHVHQFGRQRAAWEKGKAS